MSPQPTRNDVRHYYPNFANMPRINVVMANCIKKAVAFRIKCPNATIPECMLACGFSKIEADDRAMWMAVYCHLKKVGESKQDDKNNEYVTPPTLAVDVPVLRDSALSSVTVSSLYILSSREKKKKIPFFLAPQREFD